jgi:hypothetical protein
VALLLEARPPEYVALMGYLPSSAEIDRAAGELRAAVRAATRATTTFGYGPRFLHSTGQLHKGGPRSGRFLQLLHQPREDVEIPDAPYTFATLEAAQAQGDFETLRGTGRPVERLTLAGEDLPRSLRHLAAEVARRSGVDRGVDRGSSGGSNPRATQARPA